jgi:hypothetical protein
MKKLASIIIMIAMFCIVNLSHAGSMRINGYVSNPEGRGIPGATLTWLMLGEVIEVTTDANGWYDFTDHNWCSEKFVWLVASGYFTIRRGVRDNSCCECVPDCDPDDPSTTCAPSMRVNFTMNGLDSDQDGYYNAEDNCPTVPNGPDGGTCTAGSKGPISCVRHGDCGGCLAFCSRNQEDSDGDGIGDACEGGSSQASVVSSKSLAVKGEILTLFGLWLPMYCNRQGGCDYECLGQAIEDFMNGPEMGLGRPIYPEGPRPYTYECPDFLNFEELVNLLIDELFDKLYGDNFPEE